MADEGVIPLRLVPVAGPPFDAIRVEPHEPVVLGRSAACDVQLPDPSVSRRHASIACRDGAWYVTDLASRAGVSINSLAIPPDTAAPLADLDLLTIGPWTFRARTRAATALPTIAVGPDRLDPGERVDPIPERELKSLASRRLDLLIDCAARINAASDESQLALAVLEAAREGTGFPRAAVLRIVDDQVQLLASSSPHNAADGADYSRSLINAAAKGQIVRLSRDAAPTSGESIARLGIQAAICAPIMLAGAVEAILYLDDRRHDADVRHDAAAFCQALCRIGGLALANLRRASLERANAAIMREVGAAAEAQRLLMPTPDGVCAGIAYSVRMRPGRFVAGDLFNILPLAGGRVGVYLGDVAGKGVGAAILMATTQTMLNAALRDTHDPADALNRIGPEIASLLPGGRFISLWVGVIDPGARAARYVDAGHGFWALRRPGQAPRLALRATGWPLGIDPDTRYDAESLQLDAGAALVLLSDGVFEQRSRDGEPFGAERVIEILSRTGSPAADADGLFAALLRHAPGERLDDDVTIASLRLP